MIETLHLNEHVEHQSYGLDVLNCARGHLKIEFDKSKPKEIKRAKEIIQDMLRRGYTILVEHDGQTSRVVDFDPDREVYIVQDGPKKGGRKKGVPMKKSKATGVGRTAGG